MSAKEERIRADGAAWALEIAEQKGIDGLREELKKRGMYRIPLRLSDSVLHEFEQRTKKTCVQTILITSLAVLHDEFGFGHDRLNRFRKRFNVKADSLQADYATWPDYIQMLKDECGIEVEIDGI